MGSKVALQKVVINPVDLLSSVCREAMIVCGLSVEDIDIDNEVSKISQIDAFPIPFPIE